MVIPKSLQQLLDQKNIKVNKKCHQTQNINSNTFEMHFIYFDL